MDHNAWSPAGPGKHGYMQVGLGRDRKFFNEGDYRHAFVGTGKHLIYCGWYHVIRVDPLTLEEWATLPPKSTYSETTMKKEKNKELKSAQQVLAMYNSGELRAPCVRLQCVKFDTAFYQELVRANDLFFEHKPRPMPPCSSGGSSTKRRRVSEKASEEKVKDDESEEEVSLALAVGLAHSNNVASSAAVPSSISLSDSATMAASSVTANAWPLPPPSAEVEVAPPITSLPTQTRSATGSLTQDCQSGPLKLRIPGGRALERPHADHWQLRSEPSSDQDEDTNEEDESELSSVSDDDDMYAD
ncbi:hypothetical protein OH77DRAFT_1492336 [Trametes cingulata]|nr:hypothetical protein OH77DRAFT_1492336 [Trametes cingulata]